MSVIADLMRPGISRREIPVDHALTYILKAMTINPFHGSIAAMYRESQALSAIVALSTLSPVDRPRVGGSRSHRDLAHATREILDRNLSSPPTINALARMLGTNDTTLRRAFRQTFDMTILRYAIHRRLEVARILLNQSDLQISEIAYRMGYNDPANFTTAYRQHFGHPPSTDRQKS
ncbi:MAG: AraC family transcriptional regulator [Candidatus Devosia phytovorans]|uniref:AraC family transcriptional regulator n=1 Tax=Candidatus Devosia phytovorans TaxID=3121372 RepID=A0AAJ5VS93_9HYPH|nr:AraC family transcriptional regulator [Devosia sp.]WEK02985.1 MAG: AraC family transcriptional regulator [Devosia sp.]